MGWPEVVSLAAAAVALSAAAVTLVVARALALQTRRLDHLARQLEAEALPLVSEARVAVGRASGEMARIEAVLEGTEAVTAAVDSASRLAHRAFTNPVVKVLAFGAGTATGWRRLRQPVVHPVPPGAAGPRRRGARAPARTAAGGGRR
ncbi:MAG: hypothetical protein ACYCU7_03890 [Acidimicrobiales bacterium]